MVDLVQVVIFGCEPKDRDRRDPGPNQFGSGIDRGSRFQERIERPTEESHLLACDGYDCALAEAFERLHGSRTRSKGLVLALKDFSHAGTPGWVINNLPRLISQPGAIRRTGIELSYFVVMKKVVQEQI